ncbi:MAG: hypothetical protein AAGE89_18315 [Pseudomonadota bacterium]
MNRIQSLVTICFILSVPLLVLIGQAKIGALIIATAMAASIVTVLYDLLQDAKAEKSIYRYDWK